MYCFCFEDLDVFIRNEKKELHTAIFKRGMRATLRVRWKFEPKQELNRRVWKVNNLEGRTLSSDYRNVAEQTMVF